MITFFAVVCNVETSAFIFRRGTQPKCAFNNKGNYHGADDGQRNCQETAPSKYLRFCELTGIEVEANCGLDTSHALGDWHGVSVMTEIVGADFAEVQQKRAEEVMPAQAALFAAACSGWARRGRRPER